jgi:hypothetical protein
LNGTSTISVTGSASISARRATVGPGFPPLRTPTRRNSANVLLNFDAQRSKMRGDESRRALLRVSELRMLMNVVTPSCHLVGDCRCSPVDFRRKCWVGDDDLLSRRAVPAKISSAERTIAKRLARSNMTASEYGNLCVERPRFLPRRAKIESFHPLLECLDIDRRIVDLEHSSNIAKVAIGAAHQVVSKFVDDHVLDRREPNRFSVDGFADATMQSQS